MAELESMRKSCLPPLFIGIGILILGVVSFAINLILAIILIIVGIVFIGIKYSPVKKAYCNAYKQKLVMGVFANNFDNVRYNPADGYSEGFISHTGFISMGNIFHSEDLITGEYKGVSFSRADLRIEDETTTTDSDGNTQTHTTTYFNGRWIILTHNKNFDYDLQVVQKGFGYANTKSGFFTRKDEKRHKVEFENEAFNKKFQTFCQDEQEAFYLITPPIMEELFEYSDAADGKVMLGFKDNEVHVAVHNNKDSLEPSLFRSVNYKHDLQPIEAEVNAIRDFVDKLKIDREIYK